jgi:hypothetical protein
VAAIVGDDATGCKVNTDVTAGNGRTVATEIVDVDGGGSTPLSPVGAAALTVRAMVGRAAEVAIGEAVSVAAGTFVGVTMSRSAGERRVAVGGSVGSPAKLVAVGVPVGSPVAE